MKHATFSYKIYFWASLHTSVTSILILPPVLIKNPDLHDEESPHI